MPLASFLDNTAVDVGIVVGWIFLIFLIRVMAPRLAARRPLGIWLVVGVFALLLLMPLVDWLVDDAF